MEKSRLKMLLLATVALTDQPLSLQSHKFLATYIGLGPVFRFLFPWAVEPAVTAVLGLTKEEFASLKAFSKSEPMTERRKALECLLAILEKHDAFGRGLHWDRHGDLL